MQNQISQGNEAGPVRTQIVRRWAKTATTLGLTAVLVAQPFAPFMTAFAEESAPVAVAAAANGDYVVDQSEVQAAQKQLDVANKELESAKQAQASAQSRLDAANKAVAAAQTEANAAKQKQAAAQAAVDAAQKQANDAAAAQKSAQSAYDQLVNANKDKIQQYQEAQQAADTAKGNLEYYQGYVVKAQKDLDAAKATLATAQTSYDAAVTKAGGDVAAVKRGTYGFFESIGAQDAVDILNNKAGYVDQDGKPFNQYNDPKNVLDATSLENVARAFDMMDECNQLRQRHGLGALKVTSALMAVAETDANWSSYNYDHAGNNGNDYSRGENLAWGYSDPFIGWYDAEKKEYDAGNVNFNDVGHYLNIVNGSYTVTGYAYSQYGNTDAQQFSLSSYSPSGQSYSVAEYRQMFQSYYQKVTGGVSADALVKAQVEVVGSEGTLETYKGIVSDRQKDYNEAVKQAEALKVPGLDAAKAKVDAANKAVTAANDALGKARGAKSSADQAVTSANGKLTSAQAEQKSAQAAKNSADGQVATANKKVTDAKNALATAQKGHRAYTVAFNSNGGSSVAAQKVVTGKSATKPADPKRSGYVFGGWYADAKLTRAYDFKAAVKADVTLYAKWTKNPAPTPQPKTYTVTFNSDGGSAVAAQKVTEGKAVAKPADPKRNGYTFGGWYADAKLTKAYDFKAVVKGDLTLYAKWTKNSTPAPQPKTFTVTFNSNGGSAVAAQKVTEGKAVAKPADPTRSGYTFAGWYSDAKLTKAYDFKAVVKADATLYAKWSKSSTPAPKPESRPSDQFTDVTGASTWVINQGYLDYAVEHGLMTGYRTDGKPNGKFGPTDTLTRGQVAVVLYRVATGRDSGDGSMGFKDAGAYPYYRTAIKWLKDQGLATGDRDPVTQAPLGTFRPDDPITRQELATLVYRFALKQGVKVGQVDASSLGKFSDDLQVMPYAREAVAWCNAAGIITGGQGADAGRLMPLDNAQRAQAAKIFTVLHRDVLKLGK